MKGIWTHLSLLYVLLRLSRIHLNVIHTINTLLWWSYPPLPPSFHTSAYEEHRAWRSTFDPAKQSPLLVKSWPCNICEWAGLIDSPLFKSRTITEWLYTHRTLSYPYTTWTPTYSYLTYAMLFRMSNPYLCLTPILIFFIVCEWTVAMKKKDSSVSRQQRKICRKKNYTSQHLWWVIPVRNRIRVDCLLDFFAFICFNVLIRNE